MRLFGRTIITEHTSEPNDSGDDAWAWVPPRSTPQPHLDTAEDHGPDAKADGTPEAGDAGEADRMPVRSWSSDPGEPSHGPVELRPWWNAVPARGWAGLASAAAVAIGVVVAAGHHSRPIDSSPADTTIAVASSTTPAPQGACAGLTGTVVTDGPGDQTSVAGVVAAFENAYYTVRSADAAMRLLAPQTGIDHDALAAGIASVPAASTHCVAVTPISDTAANVHVVELHPDGQRIDYLQVVDTQPAPGGGLVISNIQRQG